VACDAADRHRIRAYDTTYRFTRVNNGASQVTILVISNPTDQPVAGTVWFYDGATGALAGQAPVAIGPKQAFVLSTQGVMPGFSGTATFSNDAPYGALAGKAVALESATGFTFDSAMAPRPASTKMVPRDN
jgi:hypothetical protein